MPTRLALLVILLSGCDVLERREEPIEVEVRVFGEECSKMEVLIDSEGRGTSEKATSTDVPTNVRLR